MGQLRLLGEPAGSDDHAALANLAFPHAGHTGFVAAAGLAGGQTITGEKMVDTATLLRFGHATGPTIRGPASGDLLSLAGTVRAGDRLGIGADPDVTRGIRCAPALSAASGSLYVIDATPGSCSFSGGGAIFIGLYGNASVSLLAGVTSASLYGLQFTAGAAGAGVATALYGTWSRLALVGYSNANAPNLYTLFARQPIVMTSTYPANSVGLKVENMGGYNAATMNAYGVWIDDITLVGGNKFLIEAGPATPYLRLIGGAAPGANLTNLYLNEAGNLRRVQWKDYSALVAGDRVMVLV